MPLSLIIYFYQRNFYHFSAYNLIILVKFGTNKTIFLLLHNKNTKKAASRLNRFQPEHSSLSFFKSGVLSILLLPQLIRRRFPLLRIRLAPVAEIVHTL